MYKPGDAFWALIVRSQKEYTQKVKQSFYITNASLDSTRSGDEEMQVTMMYRNKNYLLCTLKKNSVLQASLNIKIMKGEFIKFYCSGQGYIHLTGYFECSTCPNCFSSEKEEETTGQNLKRKAIEPPKDVATAKRAKQPPKSLKIKVDDTYNTNAEESSMDSEEDSYISDNTNETESTDSSDNTDISDLSDVSDVSDSIDKLPLSMRIKSLHCAQKKKSEESVSDKKQETQNVEQKQNKSNEQDAVESCEEFKQTLKSMNLPYKPTKDGSVRFVYPGIIVYELKTGKGTPVRLGSTVKIYYKAAYRYGSIQETFDSHLDTGDSTKKPYKLLIGQENPLKGMDKGIKGMKSGGKRRIVVSPCNGYGSKGFPPMIPPKSTLIFDVTLVSIK